MNAMPKKAVPPTCQDCGASKPQPVRREGFTDEQIAADGGLGAYDWLCGSCLFKRTNPEYRGGPDPYKLLKKTLPVQSDRLFEV